MEVVIVSTTAPCNYSYLTVSSLAGTLVAGRNVVVVVIELRLWVFNGIVEPIERVVVKTG